MASDTFGGLILREISPDDSVSGLSLGDDALLPLKIFLRKHARRYHTQNTGKTYVLVYDKNPRQVVAYVTLICSQVLTESVGRPDGLDGYAHDDFPAIKIARLAVDYRHRGKDLGKTLVDWSVGVASGRVMPHVGCRFLIVDSKHGSVGFYKKQGFQLVNTQHDLEHPLMYLDIGKLPP